jgi:hypothetical protein
MLHARREARRRSVVVGVRGLVDVDRAAPEGEVEGSCLGMGTRAARDFGGQARRSGSRLDVRVRGRCASEAGLRSPHEASASLGNGT